MIRRPPSSNRTDNLFPYTSLFRSLGGACAPAMLEVEGRPGGAGRAAVCRGSGGAGRGLAVKRGDIVAVSLQGDYGKPRPALIVQSNLLAELESLVICPITSAVRDAAFRITGEPDNANGLRVLSQVMVDKLSTLPRSKISKPFGRLDDERMKAVDRALLLVVGLI